MPYFVAYCAALIGATFAVSAFTKLRSRADFAEFASSLVRLRLASRRRARALAVVVAAAEALAALLVVPPGLFRTLGLALAVMLLIPLTTVVVRAVVTRQDVACRCFGASEAPLGRAHIVRNAVLLGVAAPGLGGALAGGTATPHWAPLIIAVVAGVVTAVPLMRIEDVLFLLGRSTTSLDH